MMAPDQYVTAVNAGIDGYSSSTNHYERQKALHGMLVEIANLLEQEDGVTTPDGSKLLPVPEQAPE